MIQHDTRPAERGLVLALCGPDGTGKSTVADALTGHIDAPIIRLHHRPETLPYPSNPPARDYTQPHLEEAHGRWRSVFKVLYLY
ncbi:MAG: hypothetical protein ACRDU9_05180, partial [Acidimicrobiia bacterium]